MDFNVGKLIEEYGFPTLAVGGLVYLVYYVWRCIAPMFPAL